MKILYKFVNMKKLLFFILSFAICGCSVSQYASVNKVKPLDNYKYFYVYGTTEITSSSGYVSGGQSLVLGASSSTSVNPTDVISGYLMKKGFVRVPEVNSENADRTLVVSYGESGRHPMFLGYATEVTLQFLDASNNEIVATSTAAGIGETEADDIRKALLNGLDNLFK